jgi:hypothetical protein
MQVQRQIDKQKAAGSVNQIHSQELAARSCHIQAVGKQSLTAIIAL